MPVVKELYMKQIKMNKTITKLDSKTFFCLKNKAIVTSSTSGKSKL